MNQINPLHIGALLVVVLLYLFYTLSTTKDSLAEEKLLYMQSEKLALELHSLKESYADAKKTQSSLERIFSQRILKPAALEIQKEKKSLKVSSKSMDLKSLNALMSKLLNGTYNIKAMQIKKLSDTKASFEMEIAW